MHTHCMRVRDRCSSQVHFCAFSIRACKQTSDIKIADLHTHAGPTHSFKSLTDSRACAHIVGSMHFSRA